MGEVFRAKDTRLGRDVAIRVLPASLSSNPEVRARFEREAKTISSLNHPNICTLFDVGRAPAAPETTERTACARGRDLLRARRAPHVLLSRLLAAP